VVPQGSFSRVHDCLRFFDVGERSAAHAFAGQFPKPSLYEIEPTGTGRDKVRDALLQREARLRAVQRLLRPEAVDALKARFSAEMARRPENYGVLR